VCTVIYCVIYDSYCISFSQLGTSLCATSEGNSISDRGLSGYISVCNNLCYVIYSSYCISYSHLGESLCATSAGNSIRDKGLSGYISMCTNIYHVLYDSYCISYSHLGTSLCVLFYIVIYMIHIVYHRVNWVHLCVPHLKETQ